MNYLAHLQLTPRNSQQQVGALMGDFRRHVNAAELPAGVLLGIENHQRVDRFTDIHPRIRELKQLFSPGRRRFAGIIIDVVFDHFLSCHWQAYNRDSRTEFIRYAYACLRQHETLMPYRMQRVTQFMIAEDWLGSYADLEGIATVIDRISRRIRFENTLRGAIEEVRHGYAELENGFLDFYPQLIEHMEAARTKRRCLG